MYMVVVCSIVYPRDGRRIPIKSETVSFSMATFPHDSTIQQLLAGGTTW